MYFSAPDNRLQARLLKCLKCDLHALFKGQGVGGCVAVGVQVYITLTSNNSTCGGSGVRGQLLLSG